MDRNQQLTQKLRGFSKVVGKLSKLSVQALVKKQEAEEEQNLQKLEIEKGSSFQRFIATIQRVIKTDNDAKYILSVIHEYEAVQRLFRADTEEQAKYMLCKGMSLEVFQAGEVILTEGDSSNNKFYIIAKGSVSIVKMNDTTESHSNVGIKSDKETFQLKKNLYPNIKDKIFKQLEKYGKLINVLNFGQGFGEAAIFETDQKNAKRGATIISCEDETTLLVVFKREFLKFKDSFSEQGKEKAELLSSLIPKLQKISSSQTRSDLIFYFQEEGGLRGKHLTVEDETGNRIFALKQGSVEIEKNFVNSKNLYYQDIQKMKIASVGNYSFLGEEILYEQQEEFSKYKYTITISSVSAKYYWIKKSILQNKFPSIARDILKEYSLKEDYRQSTIRDILSKDAHPTNMIDVNNTLHEYNKTVNSDLFLNMKIPMVESHNRKIFKEIIMKEKEITAENKALLRSNVIRQLEERFPSTQEYVSRKRTNSQELLNRNMISNQYKNQNNSQESIVQKKQELKFYHKRSSTLPLGLSEENKQEFFENGDGQNLVQYNLVENGAQKKGSLDVKEDEIKNVIERSESPKINDSQKSNPIYCDYYLKQKQLNQNFMDSLESRLKLMNSAPKGKQTETSELDLGYLESFKKKQRIKMIMSQKQVDKQKQGHCNQSTIMEKMLEKIKTKIQIKQEHRIIKSPFHSPTIKPRAKLEPESHFTMSEPSIIEKHQFSKICNDFDSIDVKSLKELNEQFQANSSTKQRISLAQFSERDHNQEKRQILHSKDQSPQKFLSNSRRKNHSRNLTTSLNSPLKEIQAFSFAEGFKYDSDSKSKAIPQLTQKSQSYSLIQQSTLNNILSFEPNLQIKKNGVHKNNLSLQEKVPIQNQKILDSKANKFKTIQTFNFDFPQQSTSRIYFKGEIQDSKLKIKSFTDEQFSYESPESRSINPKMSQRNIVDADEERLKTQQSSYRKIRSAQSQNKRIINNQNQNIPQFQSQHQTLTSI